MSKRYESTKVEQTKLGDRVYKTTIYPTITKKNDDIYVMSKEGDRCDALAYRFYGSPELWWFIARVNNLSANNIPAGTSLRIPRKLDDAEGF